MLLLVQIFVLISSLYSSCNMLRYCLIDVDFSIKVWIVIVVGKLMLQIGQMYVVIRDMLEKYMGGVDVEFRQVGI